MNRLLALAAFMVFLGFLGILALEVPEWDLMAVIALTLGLAAWDLATSSGRGKD